MALDFLAGCVGGVAGVVVGYPLDTIKVHLQTQDFKNPKYHGTWNCFTTILKQESFHGLYRGMTSPMAGVAVVNAIAFGVYGNVQRLLSDDKDSLFSVTLAGAAAGMAQSLASSPIELAKTRMQLQQEAPKVANGVHHHLASNSGGTVTLKYTSTTANTVYKNPVDCLVKIHKQEGIRGVYRGFAITAIRDIPSFGIYFGTYEFFYQSLSRNLSQRTSDSTSKVLSVILAGGLSGTASWLFTYPIDVIKTRIQMDGQAGGVKNYNGIADCFLKSYKNEGFKAFTRGLNSTVIRAFPTNAATFLVADMIFKVFGPAIEGHSGEEQRMIVERKDKDVAHPIFVQEELNYLSSCAEFAIW